MCNNSRVRGWVFGWRREFGIQFTILLKVSVMCSVDSNILTESSMFRGSLVSIKESESMIGLPVVKLKPLSKQYTAHQTTLRRSFNNVFAVDVPEGGSR